MQKVNRYFNFHLFSCLMYNNKRYNVAYTDRLILKKENSSIYTNEKNYEGT